MNSLEGVRSFIINYLKEALRNGTNLPEWLYGLAREKEFHQVYDYFFNLIADPTQSPEIILHKIDMCTSGLDLDGFSTSKCLQTVRAFACIEGLTRRKPEVLCGPWETLAWIILKFSSISNTELRNVLTTFKQTITSTVQFIMELSTPVLCPNPCLRLELFKLMRSFNCKDVYYDDESHRENIINTLIELSGDYKSFTVDQLPYFTPIDLQYVMEDNCIRMDSLMNDSKIEKRILEIIASVLKITRNFALLEKDKHQLPNNQETNEFRHVSIGNQLSACLSFGGLLSQDDKFGQDFCLQYLVQTIGNNYLLLNNVIDTLDIIKQVSLCFPENIELKALTVYKKDKLLHSLFKGHIKNIPTFQYNHEINGGISPAVENQLRYFQDNARGHCNYHDSDYESESYDSDENDYIYPYNTEGNDSEMETSD